MIRPEIIVYRSELHNCFYVSTDGGVYLKDPDEPDSWDGPVYWLPGEVKDLREVWRSGDKS